jgi:hypothetical protein
MIIGISKIISLWKERRLHKQAVAWKEVNGRIVKQFQDLLYVVWENGYISGRGCLDPEVAWKYIADEQGIKKGISPQLKEISNGTGKDKEIGTV